MNIVKYPRTHHIEGSRLQPGDEDLDSVPFSRISGRHLVVEEKMDGANSAISFDEGGNLLLQSRGHFLTGGEREKHFAAFKKWAATHAHLFREVLAQRYICYGEWLFAKHTVFYNRLPHYWLEFDILDRQTRTFLDTRRRAELLNGLPISSVAVLHEGRLEKLKSLHSFLGKSQFIEGNHMSDLRDECVSRGLSAEKIIAETDSSTDMEGLYIKVEEDGIVKERFKFIRPSFLTAVLESGSHWLNRPIIPNRLKDGCDIFSPGACK